MKPSRKCWVSAGSSAGGTLLRFDERTWFKLCKTMTSQVLRRHHVIEDDWHQQFEIVYRFNSQSMAVNLNFRNESASSWRLMMSGILPPHRSNFTTVSTSLATCTYTSLDLRIETSRKRSVERLDSNLSACKCKIDASANLLISTKWINCARCCRHFAVYIVSRLTVHAFIEA